LIATQRALRSHNLNLPDLSHHALNVWRRNRDVYLKLWKTELIMPLVEPILVLTAMGIGLGHFISLGGSGTYVAFLAPGILAQFGMFQATFECGWGAYFRMENQGTYTAVAATPATLDDIVAGEVMWAATRSVINSFYILAVLLALTPTYGIVQSPMAVLVLPVAYLLGLCFGALTLCFTAMAPAISFLGYYFNVVIIPLFWLSGTFFPIERLPDWLQVVAWATPPAQIIATYRHFLHGAPQWADLFHITLLLIETVGFGYIAMLLVRRKLIK
jgi:lipooligosaccharide transport system permease protein